MSSERMIAMKTFTKAVAAGLMIDLGVAVYLSCPNKIAGSLLFSVALFCICSFKMNLFTGKIGYILQNRNDPNCLIIWLGNFVGCAGGAALLRLARPQLSEAAAELMAAKLRLSWPSVAILGFFCGLLMYLAVENYASNPSGAGKVAGILLCISTFILSGFEHSIADIGYAALAVSGPAEGARMLLFVVVVSVFNGVGSVFLHSLNKFGRQE